MTTETKLTESDLAQFTGTEHWYRHNLVRKVLYTDGVKYVGEKAGAYWLIDKIATNQMLPELKKKEFQVWTLKVTGSKAELIAEDGNGKVLFFEPITFTDFPLPMIRFYFTDNTILLPSEY